MLLSSMNESSGRRPAGMGASPSVSALHSPVTCTSSTLPYTSRMAQRSQSTGRLSAATPMSTSSKKYRSVPCLSTTTRTRWPTPSELRPCPNSFDAECA